MRFEVFVLVVSLALSVWLAQRGASQPVMAGRDQTADRCLPNCLARTQELGCKHPERCAEQCAKVKAAVYCKEPLDAFMKCAYRLAKHQWECGGDGVAVAKGPHACDAERDNMTLCLHTSKGKL